MLSVGWQGPANFVRGQPPQPIAATTAGSDLGNEVTVHETNATPSLKYSVARVCRVAATILALVVGGLQIADLWLTPLARESLLAAGRGTVFMLIGLGLMGTARLSLVLVMLLILPTLMSALQSPENLPWADIIELGLLGFAALALFAPSPSN